ncbi:uncharacterized protein (TIGR00369 family) [Panacagrimonas perspica]|uniref:Uncharacterized protein (TIGR00369 family) n=1 Tax=Panacagrimonas perspica TaxID=381431 RepID=A0A4S3JYC9_9GAMM|nr:PaaI family thioesterase [Panacagrimonas perspica]TDU32227.1 uncharacterized protein (TIGR00369 family) [Panacagrimonas perspica]THD00582.1 hypothetical protein B1810_24150 [Panacagrimonas perspica]
MSASSLAAAGDIPAGFVALELDSGFNTAFGLIYRHETEQKLGFRMGPHHLNPIGVLHGGAMATFADTLVLAIIRGIPIRQPHTPTISITVDYVAAAPAGSWIEADTTLVKATRTMLFVQALITADGEIVSRTSGIYRYYGQ